MVAVYALVGLQGLWILLAFLHHRRKLRAEARVGDEGPHERLSLKPSAASLWLPQLRYLTFLELPGLAPSPRTPDWLRHGAGLMFPAEGPSLSQLGHSLRLKGGAPGQFILGLLVLILSVTPAVALVLTGLGIQMGDPAAIPDSIAAFGLYIVSCAALAGGRYHTRLSPLLLPAHPLGGALAGVSLLIGAFRGPPEGHLQTETSGEADGPEPGGDG